MTKLRWLLLLVLAAYAHNTAPVEAQSIWCQQVCASGACADGCLDDNNQSTNCYNYTGGNCPSTCGDGYCVQEWPWTCSQDCPTDCSDGGTWTDWTYWYQFWSQEVIEYHLAEGHYDCYMNSALVAYRDNLDYCEPRQYACLYTYSSPRLHNVSGSSPSACQSTYGADFGSSSCPL
jgi:hypothetical protein